MTDSREVWIREGYQVFSIEGPNAIKVSRLAKQLQRNKSAFYHYFATTDIFRSRLLEVHLNQCQTMAAKMSEDTSLDDLIETLLSHQVDLFFNRQLRVYRKIEEFEACFVKTNEFVGDAILPLWSRIIGIESNSYLARMVLQISLENFMLQITSETFSRSWLEDYFNNLHLMVRRLMES